MNEQASILFNISSSYGGVRARKGDFSLSHYYLQASVQTALTCNIQARRGFELLGRQLTSLARQAYYARQMDVVEQASQLMLALPISKEQEALAQYYQVLCAWKHLPYPNVEQVIEAVPQKYEAQGLFSLGAIHYRRGQFEAALRHYLAAARAASKRDPLTFAYSQKMIAVIRGISDEHQQSLRALEGLFPLVRSLAKHCPVFYYDFLNSYAVELGEVGRIDEARNVCAVALASPFAAAYPEFAQTRDELAAKRTAATPSIIAVPVAAPETLPSTQAQAEPEPEPARARSTISPKFRRSFSLTRVLAAAPRSAAALLMIPHPLLEQLAHSILPRSPPTLSQIHILFFKEQ